MQEGSISRRNFLKGTAIGAGALAVGGASVLTSPRKAYADLDHRLGYLPTTEIDPDTVRKNCWKWYFTGGG